MTSKTKKYPECFGNLKKVFPMGKDGLRHTPEDCLACLHKTQCLRFAIKSKDGLRVKQERVDRAYHSGRIGFFERWSKKKSLSLQEKSKSE
jgi:hypothetical protein